MTQMLGGGVPLPAQAYLVVRVVPGNPPRGKFFRYFLLNCLCCLESLWVWRTVLAPAFSGLRLGQRGHRGWDLWEIGA